ncbi:SAS5-like protein [Lachancea thermotolerans]
MSILYVNRTVRIKTTQNIISEKSPVEGLPLRQWQVNVLILGPNGDESPAYIFEKCIYRLHPTFRNPIRTKIEAPFSLKEKGWGEFTFSISCFFLRGAGEVEFLHELTFQDEVYYLDFNIKVPCHVPELRRVLELTGPVPEAVAPADLTYKTDMEKWIQKLLASDEELATNVVNKIVHHPAVAREVERKPLDECFVVDLRQLPESLLWDIGDYILNEPPVK